jgi:hypothetical protein
MGDIADQLIHDQIFGGYDNGYKFHRPYKSQRSFVWWKQRDGTRIKVHNMKQPEYITNVSYAHELQNLYHSLMKQEL